MTDAILALVPQYGLVVVFAVIFFASLGVPLPASLLVLTAGGFAAAGDFSLWSVWATTLAAYAIADQIAFSLGQSAGPAVLRQFSRLPSSVALIQKAQSLLETRGRLAVFLSHTVVGQASAYVTYLSGIAGLPRLAFAIPAILGAAIWSGAYAGIGYIFASRLADVAALATSALGFIAACLIVLLCVWYLRKRWKHHASLHTA